MPEVSFPPRSKISEKIVPALRNLGAIGPPGAHRRTVIDEAIRLGDYAEAQRKEVAHSKKHQHLTYLEYQLGHELSRLKAEGVIEGDGKGMWWLPRDAG